MKSHLGTIVAELYTRLSEDGAMVSGCREAIAQNLAACLRLADNWREVMKERPVSEAATIVRAHTTNVRTDNLSKSV